VRIVPEVETRRGVGRIAIDVDPERTDLPVGRDRAHQDEDGDQPAEKQAQAEAARTPRWQLRWLQ
jgi:hypothetical protein